MAKICLPDNGVSLNPGNEIRSKNAEAEAQEQFCHISRLTMLLKLLLRPILVVGLAAFAHGLNYDVENHCYQDLLVSKNLFVLVWHGMIWFDIQCDEIELIRYSV